MLATKSHRNSYRAAVMPETKTKILVCNAGKPARIPVIATREDLTNTHETQRVVASSKTEHPPAKSATPF